MRSLVYVGRNSRNTALVGVLQDESVLPSCHHLESRLFKVELEFDLHDQFYDS